MELDAVDVERVVGNAQQLHAILVEHPLIGDVVDGQDRGHVDAAPAQVGGRQSAWPIVDVQHVRLPVHAGAAAGNFRRRQR